MLLCFVLGSACTNRNEATLLKGNIGYNIILCKTEANEAEIMKAEKLANIHDFMSY